MQFNTFVSSLRDIQRCAELSSLREVLIEPSTLAREGRISLVAAREFALAASSLGLKPVLVWDILMTDQEFLDCTKEIQTVGIELFSAVRVQCIGAAQYLHRQHPQTKIQLIAETANCNLKTLELWCSLLGTQLERIVLSLQLPAKKITEYVHKLPVACEILAVGRILLFHSRRNLLRKQFGDLGNSWREVLAASEESHNRPFPVIDNDHGTFMYLDKDQFILHRLSELQGGVPAFLRVDLRHLSEYPDSAVDIGNITTQGISDPDSLREHWPRPTIAPFFKSNLTTKQFKFLNSELRFSRDAYCVAEVLSTEREKHTVLRVLEPFEVPGVFRAVDPNGSEVNYEFRTLKTLGGLEIYKAETDQIVLAPWMRKISTGSLILRAAATTEAASTSEQPSSTSVS